MIKCLQKKKKKKQALNKRLNNTYNKYKRDDNNFAFQNLFLKSKTLLCKVIISALARDTI